MEPKGFLTHEGKVVQDYRDERIIASLFYKETSYNISPPCTVRTWVAFAGAQKVRFENRTRRDLIAAVLAAHRAATDAPRLAECTHCGREVWGTTAEGWIHEDTGLGSAPTDEWCRVAPDHRHAVTA